MKLGRSSMTHKQRYLETLYPNTVAFQLLALTSHCNKQLLSLVALCHQAPLLGVSDTLSVAPAILDENGEHNSLPHGALLRTMGVPALIRPFKSKYSGPEPPYQSGDCSAYFVLFVLHMPRALAKSLAIGFPEELKGSLYTSSQGFNAATLKSLEK